eukprot:scaffold5935_cov29-Prasinocladus_malaysianus.AAC.1
MSLTDLEPVVIALFPLWLQVLKGEVFAFDKYSYTLVLKELPPSSTLRIIKADIIKSPGVRSSSAAQALSKAGDGLKEIKKAPPGASDVQLPAVDPARSLAKEAEAVKVSQLLITRRYIPLSGMAARQKVIL